MNIPFDTQHYLNKRHITVDPNSNKATLAPYRSRHQRPMLLNGKIHPQLQQTLVKMQESLYPPSDSCSASLTPTNICS